MHRGGETQDKEIIVESRSIGFSELLRYYRKRAKLTQSQLKNRLDALEYDHAYSAISMWETGKRLPDHSALFHYLGIALGLSEEEERALVQAWLAEKNMKDLEEYMEMKREKRKQIDLTAQD